MKNGKGMDFDYYKISEKPTSSAKDGTKDENQNKGAAMQGDGRIQLIYCDEGPTLAKIVTDSFLIYLKSKE